MHHFLLLFQTKTTKLPAGVNAPWLACWTAPEASFTTCGGSLQNKAALRRSTTHESLNLKSSGEQEAKIQSLTWQIGSSLAAMSGYVSAWSYFTSVLFLWLIMKCNSWNQATKKKQQQKAVINRNNKAKMISYSFELWEDPWSNRTKKRKFCTTEKNQAPYIYFSLSYINK